MAMHALHYLGGDRLAWREVPTPTLTEPTDAIVRPLAVAACDLDREIVSGRVPFPVPFVLGHELVGTVVARGDAAKDVEVGDVVLASFQPSCGACEPCLRGNSSVCARVPRTSMYGIGAAGGDWSGAFAAAIRIPWANYNLRRLPSGVTPEAAASASDNLADGLRAVDVALAARPGASVLIAGQGSIPLYGVLAAKHLGAGRITYASTD